MDAAVEVRGLRKSFHQAFRAPSVALDGLTLRVSSGRVFGLLGPNGSGKTTTLRCLLGLVAPDAGEIEVLGTDVGSIHRVLDRVGAMTETPSLFPGFTGRRNLQVLADIGGGHAAIDEVASRVGILDRLDQRVGAYSLGMRQRLGMAAALLKDPDLLLLDEPANGLDPAGLRDVRDLLRSLAAEGKTVVLSSHLLHEVELICDDAAVVHRGRCIASGTVDELLAQRHGEVFLEVREVRKAIALLEAEGFEVRRDGDGLRVMTPSSNSRRIARLLGEKGVYPAVLAPVRRTLEDVFLELTGGADDGRAS